MVAVRCTTTSRYNHKRINYSPSWHSNNQIDPTAATINRALWPSHNSLTLLRASHATTPQTEQKLPRHWLRDDITKKGGVDAHANTANNTAGDDAADIINVNPLNQMAWKFYGSATGMAGGVSQEELAELKISVTTAFHTIDSEVCSREDIFQNSLTAVLKEDVPFETLYH
ncbi:hypothetical protein AVEN_260470-1 [Araneus ventricosus]|uniref:Uncharacterized protein n=1 Tax=Araneus ventricosus TaxID=182803 RepID=A0A4Y2TUM2_ARAVE|nr:hypothetical protein AVEN_260470-1 [Araneus ventricosus]